MIGTTALTVTKVEEEGFSQRFEFEIINVGVRDLKTIVLIKKSHL